MTPPLAVLRRPLPFAGPVVLASPLSPGFGWPSRASATEGEVETYPAPADGLLRRARCSDAGAVHDLLDGYARQGVLLPRTLAQVEGSIDDFLIAADAHGLAACGALRVHSASLAEVAALAVASDRHGEGFGRRIVEALTREAELLGVERVFALTLEPAFFHRLGFRTVPIGAFPEKLARDCARCPRRSCCIEVAVEHRSEFTVRKNGRP